MGREELLQLAAAETLNARDRVHQAGLDERVGINVLALFDGIGCVAQSLQQVGIPVDRYEAVDNDSDGMGATRIAAYLNPPTPGFAGISRTLPSDVDKITEQHIIDLGPLHLVVGGSPCKDLSKARILPDRQGRRGTPGPGFGGPTGRLFRVKMRIFDWVRKHNKGCRFLAENSWFDHLPEDWEEACRGLGQPTLVDALKMSCTRRTRAYWTNIDLPSGWDDGATQEERDPTRYIASGWAPVGERTITAAWKGESDAPYQDTTRPYLVVNGDGVTRYLDPEEAEGLMGLPVGGTAALGCTDQQRLHGIGNGMDIRCLNRVFAHFTTATIPEAEKPIVGHLSHKWVTAVPEGCGKAPLDVVGIAPWLTSGPCPVGADNMTDRRRAEWDVKAIHPQTTYLIKEWASGVDIRYRGPREGGVEVPNNPSFTRWPEESAKVVNKEVEAGRWLGPFVRQPPGVFLQTPMAMVEEADKYRHITNATMGACVNDHIPDPDEPLRLTTHVEIQRRIRLRAGRRGTQTVWMAKRDIRSAYRNLAIRPEDWGVAGLLIAGRYYVDTALNFGTRSSPDKFCELSDAMEWVLRRWGVDCVHYIDDFIFIGSSQAEVEEQVRRFDLVCKGFGIPVKEEKDVGPAQCLTVLGVEYDLMRGVVRMPQRQIDKIVAGCKAILRGPYGVKEAESLLGVITWASQCMPQVMPFTARLWDAKNRAVEGKFRRLQVSQGLRDDMRWWLTAIEEGLGRAGTAIICVERASAVVAHADAGTEWGVGGWDDAAYYKAPLLETVRKRAIRKTRESSTFLELYNLLVMARALGPTWTGKYVQVRVDNNAILRFFKKGRGRRQEESDIVREVYLLQVKHQWAWTLRWVPRERNEAADALSKNDMDRFWANAPPGLREVALQPQQLELPSGRVAMSRTHVRNAVCASGLGDAPRQGPIKRMIFKPIEEMLQDPLWEGLGTQVEHVQSQIPTAGHTTGVNKYLSLLKRAKVPLEVGLPVNQAQMRNNLLRFAVDELLAYEVWDEPKQRWRTKSAVSAQTACRYVDQVSKYWSTYAQGALGVNLHLHHEVKSFKEHLRRSLPHKSRQKKGVNATMMRKMVAWIRHTQGQGSLQEAMLSLMWAGLLRPGEVTTTPSYPAFDVTRHPTREEVSFFDAQGAPVQPGEGSPERMEFLVKYSKTDQRRMAATTIVVGHTGDTGFCPLMAMWHYLERTKGDPKSHLFGHKGKAVAYATLRSMVTAALQGTGMTPKECEEYGGHSFRIGAAQALALAGRSMEYTMAMGRWRCMESVLTYVRVPTQIRVLDIRDMVMASRDGAHAAALGQSVFRAAIA